MGRGIFDSHGTCAAKANEAGTPPCEAEIKTDLNMSNPFGNSVTPPTLSQQMRREKFKVGLYVGLATATLLIAGTLIEGCNRQPVSAAATSEDPADALVVSTNESNSTNTPPAQKPDVALTPTNSAKAPPPAPEPVGAAPVPTAAPVTPSGVAAPGSSQMVYVVKRGDTLSRIARAHGTTVKALKAANGIEGDRIDAGQKLKLPSAGARVAGPAQG